MHFYNSYIPSHYDRELSYQDNQGKFCIGVSGTNEDLRFFVGSIITEIANRRDSVEDKIVTVIANKKDVLDEDNTVVYWEQLEPL